MIEKITDDLNKLLNNMILLNGEINSEYNKLSSLNNKTFGKREGISVEEEKDTIQKYNNLQDEGMKAFLRLYINDSMVEIFIEKYNTKLNKYADILIGFVNKTNTKKIIDINCNRVGSRTTTNDIINHLEIEPNMFSLILDNTFLPMGNIYKNDIYLNYTLPIIKLYTVYGVINTKERMKLWNISWIYKIGYNRWLINRYGIIDIVDKGNLNETIHLNLSYIIPDLDLWYINYQKKRKEIEQIENELIEKTWHPSRLNNWILDDNDKKELL
jgi:hypothetical protein